MLGITPDRFRSPEQGMLTLFGNPTESTSIDLALQTKAWDKAVADFAMQGVHLFFPHIPVTDCWKGEDRYDFSPMEAIIRRTLKSDPAGSLILRLKVNAPTWWIELHPDQVLRYADGTDSVRVHWGMEVKTPLVASKRDGSSRRCSRHCSRRRAPSCVGLRLPHFFRRLKPPSLALPSTTANL